MSHTCVGSGLWNWDPFRRLERDAADDVGRAAKLVWIAIYTAPEAKHVPGLFAGSITTLSESMGTNVDVVRTAIDRLIEDGLVEIDIQRRLIRLVELPDAAESPSNGNAIRGWWRRFQNMPACPIRDQHVHTIRWLLDEYVRVSGKPLKPDHVNAWNETFGRMMTSVPRRPRPGRKHLQTSLFDSPSSQASDLGDGSKLAPMPLRSDQSGQISPILPIMENQVPVTDTKPTPNTRERDPDRDLDQADPDPEGGAGGAPVLRLVPPTPPVHLREVDELCDLLREVAGGSWRFDRNAPERASLSTQLDHVGGIERALLEAWMRATGLVTASRVRDLITVPGAVVSAIEAAHRWRSNESDRKADAEVKSRALRAVLAEAGMEALVT